MGGRARGERGDRHLRRRHQRSPLAVRSERPPAGHGQPDPAVHESDRDRSLRRALSAARGPEPYFQVSWFLRLSPLLAVTSTSATQPVASGGGTPGSASSTTPCGGATSSTFGLAGVP